MRRSTFTGMRDIDIDILNKLDDKKLIEMCEMDQYLYSICNDQVFWQRRVISTYRKYLTLEEMKKGKGDRSWSDYYIEVHKLLKKPHLEYEAAVAMRDGRNDLVTLLKEIKDISITPVVKRSDDFTEEYFVSKYGVRQGSYYLSDVGDQITGNYLDGKKIGKWVTYFRDPYDYSIDEYYNTGMLKSHESWSSDLLLEREIYDESGKPTQLDLWKKQYY